MQNPFMNHRAGPQDVLMDRNSAFRFPEMDDLQGLGQRQQQGRFPEMYKKAFDADLQQSGYQRPPRNLLEGLYDQGMEKYDQYQKNKTAEELMRKMPGMFGPNARPAL